MRKKHRRQLLTLIVAYLFCAGTNSEIWAAASGNYTDLLPVGAAANTTVISNGSGWSLTTLPVTQTFGDGLSRVVTTVYQSTGPVTIANTVAPSSFTMTAGLGFTGSTIFPLAWVASGRTVRVTAAGRYSTSATAPNWTWDILMGTTTVLNTGAVASVGNQTNQWFKAEALLTIGTTGGAGTVNGTYTILTTSSSTGGSVLCYSTTTASAVTVSMGSQLTIAPRFTWGTASNSNTLTANNVMVEFLN